MTSETKTVAPDSGFRAIYETQCALRGETPDHSRIYQGLDEVWAWIEARPELEAALSEHKLCIMIPIACATTNAPKYFYDAETEDGQRLYAYDPTTDALRAEILNKLAYYVAPPMLVEYYGGKRGFLLWKLQRLEKRSKLGTWAAYAKSYR